MSNSYLKRLANLRQAIQNKVLWIENPIDVFYLAGVRLSAGTIIVNQKTATLFVDGRYTEAAKKCSAIPVASIDEITAHLPKTGDVYFDRDTVTYGRYLTLEKQYNKTFKPFSSFVMPLRMIKDTGEIKKMQKSAELLWKGFVYARSKLKSGMTEKQLMLIFESYVKKRGAEALSFDPIIAFGPNTAMPHYHTGDAELRKSDIVLFDAGVVVDGYCSDMTRTFFFGKPPADLVIILETVKKAQVAACKASKPGVALKDLDQIARGVMAEERLEEYFVHSLGHGIGLEVHEPPRLSSQGADKNLELKSGMVVTIEPGLYVPGLGGVRWEDTIAINRRGHQNFYS